MKTAMASLLLTGCLAVGCGAADIDDLTAEGQPLITAVPGHAARSDRDGNGFPDRGLVVTGHYEALYAWDARGAWFWNQGDGRVSGSVASADVLDGATATRCDYVINYRGDFANDPFLDTGWVTNHIRCHGHSPPAVYNTLFVHRTDPRYLGDPARAVWGGDWEIHVDAISGFGNWVRPHRAP